MFVEDSKWSYKIPESIPHPPPRLPHANTGELRFNTNTGTYEIWVDNGENAQNFAKNGVLYNISLSASLSLCALQKQSKWTYGLSPSCGGSSLFRKVSDCMTNHVLGREPTTLSREVETCASLPPDNGFIRLEEGLATPPSQPHWPLLLNFPIVCALLVIALQTIWFSWTFKIYNAKDPCSLNWECSKLFRSSLGMKTLSQCRDWASCKTKREGGLFSLEWSIL